MKKRPGMSTFKKINATLILSILKSYKSVSLNLSLNLGLYLGLCTGSCKKSNYKKAKLFLSILIGCCNLLSQPQSYMQYV